MTNGKNKNDGQPNLPEMRNEFLSAIVRLVEATAPTQQASACVDALVEHVGRLGVDVNIDYAQRDFQRASEGGRLVEACMDWWDDSFSTSATPWRAAISSRARCSGTTCPTPSPPSRCTAGTASPLLTMWSSGGLRLNGPDRRGELRRVQQGDT